MAMRQKVFNCSRRSRAISPKPASKLRRSGKSRQGNCLVLSCHSCGKKGHFKKDCPHNKAQAQIVEVEDDEGEFAGYAMDDEETWWNMSELESIPAARLLQILSVDDDVDNGNVAEKEGEGIVVEDIAEEDTIVEESIEGTSEDNTPQPWDMVFIKSGSTKMDAMPLTTSLMQ